MSSLADRRKEVLASFARAQAAGYAFNNWPGLAAELAALIPLGKGGTLDRAAWADYKSPIYRQVGYERVEFEVRFADGEIVKLSSTSDSRKPYNWGVASRVAVAFWKNRQSSGLTYDQKLALEKRLTVPSIVEMRANGTRAHMEG